MRDCPHPTPNKGKGKDSGGKRGVLKPWSGNNNGKGKSTGINTKGGNLASSQICKFSAAGGHCRFGDNCRFTRHVNGITWNEADGAWQFDPDEEVDGSTHTAVVCGICEEQGAEQFKGWRTLGGEDFHRQP